MALKDTREGRTIARLFDEDPDRLARLREAMEAGTGTAKTEPPVRCALCLHGLDRWYYCIRAPMCAWCSDRQGPVQNPWLWELKADRVSPAARDVWVSWASNGPLLGEVAACPECGGQGYIEGPGCNCGVGPSGYYGMHERHCGLEPCPRGCPFVAPGEAMAGQDPETSASEEG